MTASVLFVDRYPMAENWVMVVSEMHRYQGVSYKSDIIVISGLVFENVSHISDQKVSAKASTLEIDKCLSRNTVAANHPVFLTPRMEGEFEVGKES